MDNDRTDEQVTTLSRTREQPSNINVFHFSFLTKNQIIPQHTTLIAERTLPLLHINLK